MKTLYLVETTLVEYDDYSWDEPTPEPKVEAICKTGIQGNKHNPSTHNIML